MPTPHDVSASITNTQVSVLVNKKYRSFAKDSPTGQKLMEALREQPHDVDKICQIADIALWLAKQSFGRIVVDDRDQLRLDGRPINYGLCGKLQNFIEDGIDVSPLIKFLERVDRNPDKSVAEDLYAFLAKGNLPITPDGRFHAWKKVNSDLRSIHAGTETATIAYPPSEEFPDGQIVQSSGRLPHPIGGSVSLNREDCDPNRNQTCSRGLHACSYTYLSSFSGSRYLLLTIDPEHVTAIPTDYDQAKLRCCHYEIVAEIEWEGLKDHLNPHIETRYTPEEEPVKDAAYWAAQGCLQGKEHGAEARQLDAGYDPTIHVPEEIKDVPEFRNAFSSQYLECYEVAFIGDESSEETDEDDDSGDEEAEWIKKAYALGLEDGKAAEDSDWNYLDYTEGDHFSVLDDEDGNEPPEAVTEAYRRAYCKGWSLVSSFNEYASPKAISEGQEDGKQAARDLVAVTGDFDLDPTDGGNYHRVPEEQEQAYCLAYTQAFYSIYDSLVPPPVVAD